MGLSSLDLKGNFRPILTKVAKINSIVYSKTLPQGQNGWN